MSGLRIDIATLRFNTGVPDADGATWWIDQFEGWDAAPARQTLSTMTNRHGAVQTDHMLDQRTIVAGGLVKVTGATREERKANYFKARTGLLGVLNNMWSDDALVVHEDPSPKRCLVRRGGSIFVAAPDGTSTVKFLANLVALDPLKYSTGLPITATIPPGGSVDLVNEGDFPTYPAITTSGAGILIVRNQNNANRHIKTRAAVPGATVAEFRRRTLTGADRQSRYGLLVPSSRWWALVPGANRVHNEGGAPVTVEFRHAWL